MELSDAQIERYSRQIILPSVGGLGQGKLLGASVLVVGVGGLGAPAGYYLAAAGVGRVGLVDGDCVEISNLQRQIIHSTEDIGKKKVVSAKAKLEKLNPDVRIDIYEEYLNAANAADIMKTFDFVIDATDNFAAKFLINDACVIAGKPFSHGGVLRYQGQAMTVIPGISACYRCVFREPPAENSIPTCREAGILGMLPGIIGTVQALEAVKYILGLGKGLTDALWMYDALTMEARKVEVKKSPSCPVCGENPLIRNLDHVSHQTCDLNKKQKSEDRGQMTDNRKQANR